MSGATTLGWTAGSSFTVTNAGQTTVTVRAVNGTGIVGSTTSKVVKIDRTAPSTPTVTLRYDSTSGAIYTSGTWTNRNIYQIQSSSDANGIAGYQYSHDNVNWNAMPVNWGITWEGNWNFYVRSIDGVGNISPSSDVYTLRIDKTAPTCSTSKSSIGSTSGVTVTVTASDTGGSGYSSGAGVYYNVTSTRSYTVYDVAGNSGSCSVSVSTYNCNSYSCNPSWSCNCSWSAYSSSVTYVSSCTASGSSGSGSTYTTCSVNTYRCNCRCVTTGSTWSTTWWGTTACTASRCWNNGGGSCNVGNITATATYTVVTYKKTVYTRTESCSTCYSTCYQTCYQ
jgi:hypothetical protein